MKRISMLFAALALTVAGTAVQAAPQEYELDKGHTFIMFNVSHIGYAWLPGVFHDFSGELTYDPEDRANSSAEFTVQVPSLDTFHTTRDKHMREYEGLFNTAEYEQATFVSTSYEPTGPDTAELTGDLTIKGNTHPVTFEVEEGLAAEDPWGNFRRAFTATATVELTKFGLTYFADNNIPMPKTAEIRIAVEALRQ